MCCVVEFVSVFAADITVYIASSLLCAFSCIYGTSWVSDIVNFCVLKYYLESCYSKMNQMKRL